jgi:hypothetical protein
MHIVKHSLLAITLLALINVTALAADNAIKAEVKPAAQVHWGLLNPLREDKSPAAANLWGDRNKNGATGMLVRFNEGFSSPPHIHNISYRGLVIAGAIHNDDPAAAPLWLPPLSFWTQPAGEQHITAARDQSNLIYLEIDSGPYLVQPSEQQFDNGERPINLHADNVVWLGQQDARQIQGQQIKIAYLWGSERPGALRGRLVKLAANVKAELSTIATELRAVVIKGQLQYQSSSADSVTLAAGSYFSSAGKHTHRVSTVQESVIYLRTDDVVTVSLVP